MAIKTGHNQHKIQHRTAKGVQSMIAKADKPLTRQQLIDAGASREVIEALEAYPSAFIEVEQQKGYQW